MTPPAQPTPGQSKTERYIGRMLFDTGIPEGKADEMAKRIVRRVKRDTAQFDLLAACETLMSARDVTRWSIETMEFNGVFDKVRAAIRKARLDKGESVG